MVTGVAGFEPAHARAGLDDLAGDLVADDARELDLPPPGLDVLDGQACAAGDDARHRLARAGHRIGPLDSSSNGRFGPFSTIAFMQASLFNLSRHTGDRTATLKERPARTNSAIVAPLTPGPIAALMGAQHEESVDGRSG